MNIRSRRSTRRLHPLRTALALGALVAGATSAVAFAQVQLASGRALDANLQLGSGGYNSRVATGNPVTSMRYAPGVYNTRAYDSIATRATLAANLGPNGTWGSRNTFWNDRYNSFGESQPYRPGGFVAPPPTPSTGSGMWVGTVTFPVSEPPPPMNPPPAGR